MDDWDAALPREQGYERRDTPAPSDQDMSVVRAPGPSEGEAKRQKTTSDVGMKLKKRVLFSFGYTQSGFSNDTN
jgi:hypothetical protein